MNRRSWAKLCLATVMAASVAGCGPSAEQAYSDPDTAPRNAEPLGTAEGAEARGEAEATRLSPAQHEAAKAAGVPVHLTNSIDMKLVLIPAGEFMMGSPNDEEWRWEDEVPQHRVRITMPFYLGMYQVTQAEYERVMGTNPSWFSPGGGGSDRVSGLDTSRFPVESVSWNDAVEFCRKLSALPAERSAGREYRLPTEAEWEYACRAGTTTRYSFGDDASQLGEYAWYSGNSDRGTHRVWQMWANLWGLHDFDGRTHRVGQKRANPWGLYDMHGNVWEWCADWFDGKYYANSPVDDPQGPASGSHRVSRGGSWSFPAAECRSADRYRYTPGPCSLHFGFRLVWSSVE